MAKDVEVATGGITLADFLNESEIQKVIKIYKQHKDSGAAAQICEQVIEPNLERINKSLGQDNDPKYLAYACEYVMVQTRQ
jgi:hypothetical protein